MARRDDLLDWLEQVNPVPDPSRLYDDTEASRQLGLPHKASNSEAMTEARTRRLMPGPREPRVVRGIAVAASSAALVLVVGAFALLLSGNDTSPVGGEARILQLTFDGQECTVEGPETVSPGEIEVIYHNRSRETVWADFVRLDDGKTIQDILEVNANPEGSGRPPWTTGVWSVFSLSANSSTTQEQVTVGSGLHVIECGTWTPAYTPYFGAALTVTP